MTDSTAAVRELTKARRRQRLAGIHWSDSIYRVYILGLGGGGLVWWVASALGKQRLSAEGQAEFVSWVPAVIGLLLGVAVFGGLRSGLRGGPIPLEPADVTHLLQSPVSRTITLRRPAAQQLRRGAFLGAVGLAIGGRMASPFAPGTAIRWTALGALMGACCGVLWMSVAMIASGRRLRPVPSQAAVLLATLPVVQSFRSRSFPAPLQVLGRAARLGAGGGTTRTSDLISLAVLIAGTVGAAIVGLNSATGLDLGRAQRRAALVDQMRFAVTTQDLRAVVLLRRQLGDELPRDRPWLTIPSGRGVERAVIARSARGIARWPGRRFARLVLIAAVAGLSAGFAWRGALPLFAVPGLLALMAGLDVVEPLSQDADHPTLLAGQPRHRGRLANRLIIVPFLVQAVAGLFGAAAGVAVVASSSPLSAGLVGAAVGLCVLWAAVGVLAGALSVAFGPPPLAMMLQTPEVGFFRMAMFPGLAAVLSALPLVLARLNVQNGSTPGAGLMRGLLISAVLCYFALTSLTAGGIRDRK